jgi:hypothetical protein
MIKTPHPELIPLLEKYGISWEVFIKQGRPSKGVREIRSAIVTEIHEKGTPWLEMMEITGLSNGGIQRLTQAMWNENSREKAREAGRALGFSWKGKARPGQLEAQWANGDFDFHRGRIRSEEEREKLRAGWTPEKRLGCGIRSKLFIWGNPECKERLLSFHRSPEERERQSKAQAKRMQEKPSTYLRGRAQWVDTPKGNFPKVRVRSSYEVTAVQKLEEDSNVISYIYEKCIRFSDGHWGLPDFIVEYSSGKKVIEVKASWVLSQPLDTKVRKRLKRAEDWALSQGFEFSIWTEKELYNAS